MKLNIKNDGFMEYTLEDKTLDIYVEKGTHASLYVSYNGKNNVISSNIALEQDASLTLMMKMMEMKMWNLYSRQKYKRCFFDCCLL